MATGRGPIDFKGNLFLAPYGQSNIPIDPVKVDSSTRFTSPAPNALANLATAEQRSGMEALFAKAQQDPGSDFFITGGGSPPAQESGANYFLTGGTPVSSIPNPSSGGGIETDLLAGRYQIERLLGQGGMGGVYLCSDITLGRQCALKVIHPHLIGDPAVQLRFLNEVRAMQRLSHPGIVKLYQLHSDLPKSELFYTMEFIEGETLRDVLEDQDGMPIERIVSIIGQISDVIGYAHKEGVIHRDLKPSNIMLTQGGEIKVLDFGIATVMKGATLATSTVGGIVGTPYYMAPELLSPSSTNPVRPNADVYSLAVIAYQILTRKLPVGAYEQPSELNSNITPRIDDIIRQALDPNPATRTQTAKKLGDELAKELSLAAGMASTVKEVLGSTDVRNIIPMDMINKLNGLDKDILRGMANRGNSLMQCALALTIENHLAPSESHEEVVFNLYKRAAKGGVPYAMYKMGETYRQGLFGIDKDGGTAINWYRQAAEKGCIEAQYQLALLIEKSNPKEAHRLQENAAKKEHPEANYKTGLMYAQGIGTEAHPHIAIEWLVAASRLGSIDATAYLGDHHYDEGNLTEALAMYKSAAKQGNEHSMYMLGLIYEDGRLGVEVDFANASDWYSILLDKYHSSPETRTEIRTDAMYRLARILESTKLRKRDGFFHYWFKTRKAHKEQARRIYSELTQLGHIQGTYRYARILEREGSMEHGERARAKFKKASQLYKKVGGLKAFYRRMLCALKSFYAMGN